MRLSRLEKKILAGEVSIQAVSGDDLLRFAGYKFTLWPLLFSYDMAEIADAELKRRRQNQCKP